MKKEQLKLKLKTLPKKPGCYQMKDSSGKIIYVGKAKNLYNRVNSYFIGAHNYKTTKLVSKIDDFDYFITSTEKESLLLEINLIKKYRPRYNIMLMDDKTYPYLKLTNIVYPTISIVRDKKRDKNAKYFGPFPNVSAARNTLRILNEVYPLRKCYHLPKKVCLYYHLHQCLGPCEFKIDEKVRENLYNKCYRFLKGDTSELVNELIEKRTEAIDKLEFEKASEYNKLILSIDYVTDKQQVQLNENIDIDVFNYFVDKGYVSLQALFIRNGKLLEKELVLTPLYSNSIEDEFISFIIQYYQKNAASDELVLPIDVDASLLADTLQTKIIQPQRGKYRNLLNLCYENAKNNLEQKFDIISKSSDDLELANEQINKIFHREIKRIELFDNSHISGNFTVGACVVYDYGLPNKKEYRHYRLEDSANDLKSMEELLYRHYFKILRDDLEICDIIMVDGGKIQIDVAKKIKAMLNLNVTVCGLVKDDQHNTANLMDENYQIINIPKDSQLFFLLTRMQDEVHNFQINFR